MPVMPIICLLAYTANMVGTLWRAIHAVFPRQFERIHYEIKRLSCEGVGGLDVCGLRTVPSGLCLKSFCLSNKDCK